MLGLKPNEIEVGDIIENQPDENYMGEFEVLEVFDGGFVFDAGSRHGRIHHFFDDNDNFVMIKKKDTDAG